MRLLHINTGLFHHVDDPRQVRYAILSHVWGHEKQEQSFQEARAIQESSTLDLPHETCLARLSQKVQRFCALARRDGYDYGWVDTVCIDKTSIPELSEAINSMYDWYRLADTCYAILDDVNDAADREQFCRSKWFTRGWTLQELIAPKTVLFLSDQLELIGSKQTLSALIEAVTGIERAVLTFDLPLEALSVAHRISLAAWRKTSRVEDEAYSLMGLLGVRMPVLYGEGRYAFRRLQEELLKNANPDQTLFAWGSLLSYHALDSHQPSPGHQASSDTPIPSIAPADLLNQSLLASSPQQFKSSSHLKSLDQEAFTRRIGIATNQRLSPDRRRLFETTSQAIDAQFPLVGLSLPGSHYPRIYLVLLACEDLEGRLLSLILRVEPNEGGSTARFSVGMHVGTSELDDDSLHPWSLYTRALLLSQEQLDFCLNGGLIAMTDCTFRHLPPLANSSGSESQFGEDHASFEVRLSGWSRRLLSLQGYRISPSWDVDVALHDCTIGSVSLGPSEIVISGDRAHIVIRIGRCICEHGSRDGLLGILISSNGPPSLLERRFVSEQPHSHNHPVHLDSWIYPEGISTKDFELTCHSGSQVTVRITFAREAPLRDAQVRSYQLGIELLEYFPLASYSVVARSSRSDASPSVTPENNSPQSNGVPLVFAELEAGTDSAEAVARMYFSGPLTASGVRSKRSSLDSSLTDQSSVAGRSVQARLYGDPSTSYNPTTRSRSPSPSRWPFKNSLQASFMPNLRPPPSIASSESLASIQEHGGFSSMDDRVLAAYQGRGSSSTYLAVVGSMARRSAPREVVSSAGERAAGMAVLPTIVQEPDYEHESAHSQGYRVSRNSGESPAVSVASSGAAIAVPQNSSSTANSRVQEGLHSDVDIPTDQFRKRSLRRTLRSLGLAFNVLRKNV